MAGVPYWDRENAWDDNHLEWNWGDLGSDEEPELDKLHRRQHPSKEHAAELLFEYLVERETGGFMDSKEACTIAYYAHHGGLLGGLETIALRPDSKGHAEKIRTALKVDETNHRFMKLDVPGHSPVSMGRLNLDWPCYPPHESLHEEMMEKPWLHEQLTEQIEQDMWPPGYMEHPVAVASNHTAQPLALYIDGLPTTKHDGVIGFYT